MRDGKTCLAFVFAALAAAGCDPTWHGEGHLVDAAGKPIASATVTLDCPSGSKETAKSDAAGAFSFGGVGSAFEASSCSVKIDAPGYAARTVRTLDLCYRNTEDHTAGTPCKPGEGKLVLATPPLAPGAAPK